MQNTDKSNGVRTACRSRSRRAAIQDIRSQTVRLNFDHTLTPDPAAALGRRRAALPQSGHRSAVSADYDRRPARNHRAPGTGFPRLGGSLGNNTYGGMAVAIGPGNRGLYLQVKPTGVVQLTWVAAITRIKPAANGRSIPLRTVSYVGLSPGLRLQQRRNRPAAVRHSHCPAEPASATALPASCWANTTAPRSATPSTRNTGVRGASSFRTPGRSAASSLSTSACAMICKSPMRELWGRTSTFSADVINPNANGRLGGVIYEGRAPAAATARWFRPIRTRSRRASASPTRSIRRPSCAPAGASATLRCRLQLHRRRQQPGHGLQHHQLHRAGQRRARPVSLSQPLDWTVGALRRRLQPGLAGNVRAPPCRARLRQRGSERRPAAARQPVEHLAAARNRQRPGGGGAYVGNRGGLAAGGRRT